MAKFLIYTLIIVLFALISYALKERLGKKAVPFFVALCFAGFALIGVYEMSGAKKDKKHEQLLLAFSNSKPLKCQNTSVSKDKFNYDYGTKSFISKDKSVRVLILSIKECEFDDE